MRFLSSIPFVLLASMAFAEPIPAPTPTPSSSASNHGQFCTTTLAEARGSALDVIAAHSGTFMYELTGPEVTDVVERLNASPPLTFYIADRIIVVDNGVDAVMFALVDYDCVLTFFKLPRDSWLDLLLKAHSGPT